MKLPFSGGCSWGTIHYECSAKPNFSGECHCRDCQRTSGSGYCPVMYVPRSALKITRVEAKYASAYSESGRLVERGARPQCGSNLSILAELVPDMQGIWASSLYDPNNFRLQINVWTRSAPAWSKIDPGMR